jgi:hypothetical protein
MEESFIFSVNKQHNSSKYGSLTKKIPKMGLVSVVCLYSALFLYGDSPEQFQILSNEHGTLFKHIILII